MKTNKIIKGVAIIAGGLIAVNLLTGTQQEEQQYFGGGGYSGAPLLASKYDDFAGSEPINYVFEAPSFPEVQATSSEPVTKKSDGATAKNKGQAYISSLKTNETK